MLLGMKTALACIVSLAATMGCKRDADPSSSETASLERSIEAPLAQPVLPEASDEVAAAREPSGGDGESVEAIVDRLKAEPSPSSLEANPGVLEEVDDTGLGRDLTVELKEALGTPTECLEGLEQATSTTVRVTVSALVRPSGAVIQATAAGTGLSPQARQCIARRAEAVGLKPLGDSESQRISTVVEVDYAPLSSVVESAEAGAPDPELRNVREPLPKRPEIEPSGRPIQEPTSRPIQEPTSRPIQEPNSRRIRGPEPRPIDGWDVDESSKEWR